VMERYDSTARFEFDNHTIFDDQIEVVSPYHTRAVHNFDDLFTLSGKNPITKLPKKRLAINTLQKSWPERDMDVTRGLNNFIDKLFIRIDHKALAAHHEPCTPNEWRKKFGHKEAQKAHNNTRLTYMPVKLRRLNWRARVVIRLEKT
jgi:hypothetical protein